MRYEQIAEYTHFFVAFFTVVTALKYWLGEFDEIVVNHIFSRIMNHTIVLCCVCVCVLQPQTHFSPRFFVRYHSFPIFQWYVPRLMKYYVRPHRIHRIYLKFICLFVCIRGSELRRISFSNSISYIESVKWRLKRQFLTLCFFSFIVWFENQNEWCDITMR